jgi:N-methylhydantoinase A/oxoprolinase/acetone carboxylase beta subunit
MSHVEAHACTKLPATCSADLRQAGTPFSQTTLVGIDVGGTFTDAVAVRRGSVIAVAKVPTETDNLTRSLLAALDGVLAGIAPTQVARVSLSTTLITNLLAQGLAPVVPTLLIPGPGRDPSTYRLSGPSWTVKGAIDFRGRETVPLDRQEVSAVLERIHAAGHHHLAIVGKFSPRNPSHENRVLDWARQLDPAWQVRAGHTVSGQLNLPRRAAATALTLAIEEPLEAFFAQLQGAFQARELACPIVILKADGGTLPLDAALREPIQTIFSGPAASTMGVLAQRPQGSTSVVVDVGGTTTDLALILDGEPLFSSHGGSVDGIYLPTRAFAVRSLPLGGDSTVAAQDGVPTLLSTRAGVAACLGGAQPTLTDALRLLGWTTLGDMHEARAALARVAGKVGLSADQTAAQIVEQALSRLEKGIAEMFLAWRRERVYRIWELKQRGERHPDVVVGVGAAAEPLVPALAGRLKAEVMIPPHAAVANALGAALARTTYTTTVHVDTQHRRFEVVEEGVVDTIPSTRFTLEDARRLAREWMVRRGQALGVTAPLTDCEEVLAEQFNIVEGWSTVGSILDVRLERRCGLVEAFSPRLTAES